MLVCVCACVCVCVCVCALEDVGHLLQCLSASAISLRTSVARARCFLIKTWHVGPPASHAAAHCKPAVISSLRMNRAPKRLPTYTGRNEGERNEEQKEANTLALCLKVIMLML